jgi:AAA+ ATPase superfamily predicted ATPase
MANPFQFGRELGADELVNRFEELRAVHDTISHGEKLFVIGPRRFGKTSLLKAGADRAAEEGHIVLRYNAESFPEIDHMIRKIIEDSAAMLKGKVETIGEQIRQYFKSLRPEITFSLTQTEWKASIGATPTSSSDQIGLLVDALNGLELLASDQPEHRRVALIIDEFQEILKQGKLKAEKQIRSAIQTHKSTAYIFAGSKTRMLTDMTMEPSRPFYRLGRLLFIGEIPRTEFARFLVDKFSYSDFFAPATGDAEKISLAHKILDLAEEVPYNVQMLAHTLWNRLSVIAAGAPEKAHLTEDLIHAALETIVRQNDVFYTQVWNGLTPVQKKTLAAVVTEGGARLQSIKVMKATGIPPSTISKALESLSSQDILRQAESSGAIRYRFEDPFFSQWIRLFIPLPS